MGELAQRRCWPGIDLEVWREVAERADLIEAGGDMSGLMYIVKESL
jgi:hypothetical protein